VYEGKLQDDKKKLMRRSSGNAQVCPYSDSYKSICQLAMPHEAERIAKEDVEGVDCLEQNSWS